MTSRTCSRMTRRGSGSSASGARTGAAVVTITPRRRNVGRMSAALLLEPGDDARRSGLVALAHFVDERHRVLQQRQFGLEAVHQALARRLAGRLRAHRRAALADRLIDDREVLLQRGGGLRIERARLAARNLLEP